MVWNNRTIWQIHASSSSIYRATARTTSQLVYHYPNTIVCITIPTVTKLWSILLPQTKRWRGFEIVPSRRHGNLSNGSAHLISVSLLHGDCCTHIAVSTTISTQFEPNRPNLYSPSRELYLSSPLHQTIHHCKTCCKYFSKDNTPLETTRHGCYKTADHPPYFNALCGSRSQIGCYKGKFFFMSLY